MVKKINVMLVIDHLGFGGAQTMIKGILGKENTNAFCYVLRKSDDTIEFNNENIFFRNSRNKFDLKCLLDLKNIIKNKKIDVLHSHLIKSFFIGYLLKRIYFRDVKLIFHEHGKIFKKNWLYNLFLRRVKKKVDLFIAVSEATKRKLMEDIKIEEEKIKVLYNFVDLEKFNPEVLKRGDKNRERNKLGIKEGDFVIGFAGRLSKVKGCDYLLKAIQYINIPNFKVLIAGDGSERKKLEKLAENLNIKEKIIFLGYVKQILNFYGIINVLVVPSKSESFGISTIEAQACGIPVIASDVGALNELIKNEENGLLFEFANEKDLAEKIELIEKDKELRERLIKNGLFSVKKFSLEKYLNTLNLIYGDING